MKTLLALILLCDGFAHAQVSMLIASQAASGGGTFNCGNTVSTSPTLQSEDANLAAFPPCTTGSNTNAYTAASVQIYGGAVGVHIFAAI